MKTDASENYCVYPGEFVAANNESKIIERSMNMPDDDFDLPYINIKEFLDEYKVEITIPAIEKDKLIVFADNKLLLICAADEDVNIKKGNTFQRHIQLPADADAELAIAEYKNNKLYCYVPKTKRPWSIGQTRIIVY